MNNVYNFGRDVRITFKTSNKIFTPLKTILFKAGLSKTPYVYNVTYIVAGRLARGRFTAETISDILLTSIEVHNPHKGLIVDFYVKESKSVIR